MSRGIWRTVAGAALFIPALLLVNACGASSTTGAHRRLPFDHRLPYNRPVRPFFRARQRST